MKVIADMGKIIIIIYKELIIIIIIENKHHFSNFLVIINNPLNFNNFLNSFVSISFSLEALSLAFLMIVIYQQAQIITLDCFINPTVFLILS